MADVVATHFLSAPAETVEPERPGSMAAQAAEADYCSAMAETAAAGVTRPHRGDPAVRVVPVVTPGSYRWGAAADPAGAADPAQPTPAVAALAAREAGRDSWR
jgi:hypothetical protein